MGLNIVQYVIKAERETDFDAIRYTGDVDFATTKEFEKDFVTLGHLYDGDSYWRPKDIDAAIEWVKKNIPEVNQKRLIEALQPMKLDYSLWFYSSW